MSTAPDSSFLVARCMEAVASQLCLLSFSPVAVAALNLRSCQSVLRSGRACGEPAGILRESSWIVVTFGAEQGYGCFATVANRVLLAASKYSVSRAGVVLAHSRSPYTCITFTNLAMFFLFPNLVGGQRLPCASHLPEQPEDLSAIVRRKRSKLASEARATNTPDDALRKDKLPVLPTFQEISSRFLTKRTCSREGILKGHNLEVWRGLLASTLDRNEVRHGHRSHGIWLSFVAHGARADVDLGCIIECG